MNTTRNKPSRRRLAQIYTEAAELVGNGVEYYCCDALHEADQTGEELDTTLMFFASYFQPTPAERGKLVGMGWWSSPGITVWLMDKRADLPCQTPHIIALLLMAELAKDGQLD